jgi:hypothetical protein
MRGSRRSDGPRRPARPLVAKRQPLTVSEILELEAALMEAFRTIGDLRERSAAARHIKFPPLPSVFSESIAIAATASLFGSGWEGRYGGRASDLIVENLSSHRVLKVEVKATGRHAFQELKHKDLKADILIWLRFGCRLELGAGPITAAVVEAPGKYIAKQCRVDVRRFEAIPGILGAQKVYQFENLAAMLGAAPQQHANQLRG